MDFLWTVGGATCTEVSLENLLCGFKLSEIGVKMFLAVPFAFFPIKTYLKSQIIA